MPSSPMLRSGFSHLMFPGLNKVYLLTDKTYPKEFDKFLNVDTSTKRQEEDLTIAGFGLVPKKTEAAPFLYDVLKMSEKVQYVHDTYSLGFEVSEECVEDELYGIIKQAPKALNIAVNQTVDVLGTAVLNNGFNGAVGYRGVDGKALFAIDHPQSKAGGIVANRPAIAADFDPVALNNALETWELWTDDNALPMLIMPKYVFSGPKQRKIIGQTLGSEKEPFTADNQINAIKDWNLERMILHYLTDDEMWGILSAKDAQYLKWFWRIKPQFRPFDDPYTGNAIYQTRFRSKAGFTHWHGTYATPGV